MAGWQGHASAGARSWWVAPADFGKGPFRWVVYGEQGGPHLAISAPFYLPTTIGQRVRVRVSAPVRAERRP